MTLIRAIATVGNYTILSRIIGFGRDKLMATYIGPGPVMDALSVAIKLPSFFRRLFAEGAFNAAFVPMFSGVLHTEGKEAARTYAQEIMAWLIMMIMIVVVLFEIFMPQIMDYLAYGFRSTPQRMEIAITLTRVTMPYLLVISLTALYSGILNSFDRFAAAASSPVAGNLFMVVCMVIFHDSIADGYWLSWIILFSGLVQAVWVMVPAYREGMLLRLALPRVTPQVRRFFNRMVPGAIGSGVVQINLFIGTLIASFLPQGGISYLYFADRLNQLPLSVIGTAVSTALLPLMSRQFKSGKMSAALHNQNRAMEYGMLLVLPASVALVIGALPFIRIVFESGKFSHADAIATARTLQAFAIGLPAYVLIKIFSTSFFAKGDTKTPVIIAAMSVLIDITLSIILLDILAYVGIALATAMASWFNALCLGTVLYQRGTLQFDHKIKRFMPRCIAATILMGVAVYLTIGLVEDWVAASLWYDVLAFFSIVSVGLALFFLVIVSTKAVNFREMWKKTLD